MKYQLRFSFHAEVLYLVENPSRECDDCVAYDPVLGDYYLTFTHGGQDGSLAVQIDDERYLFTPDNLRELLSRFGIDIPQDRRIIIFPCYPQTVARKYARELVQNRILIQGNWDTVTGIGSKITDTNSVFIRVGNMVDDQEETP